jgi:ElaA protein
VLRSVTVEGVTPDPGAVGLHVATFAELDTVTLYALLKLRTDVFVVEQRCAYPELDGRDLEASTRHIWLAPDGDRAEPHAYLRILADPDGTARIGRVVVAAKARGTGLAGRLVSAALEEIGPGTPAVLEAQSYLVGFYTGFGFTPTGPEYLDDGIPHVPMRRGAR